MIYLFEDNKLDVNSKMFISGYSTDISSNFVFCKSAVINTFATCVSSKKENPAYGIWIKPLPKLD